MKILLLALVVWWNSTSLFAHKNIDFIGQYLFVDSSTSTMNQNGEWHKNIDSILFSINPDFTFTYQWEPKFGPRAHKSITTTGTYTFHKNKIILNSKYQQDEFRFFESHDPLLGDSSVKILVQTYDSQIAFFNFQFITARKENTHKRKMIISDSFYQYNVCSATFPFMNVDEIIFHGDFGQMPSIHPKSKQSNLFLLQYNWSCDWDYQYFKNFKIKLKNNKVVFEDKAKKIELYKIN
jgi:hypothetical protein